MPFSHHSHSGQFCSHATNTLAEMLAAATRQRMSVFALTEHLPRSAKHLYPEEEEEGKEEGGGGGDANAAEEGLRERFWGFVREARRLRGGCERKSGGECRVLIGFETEWIERGESVGIVREVLERGREEGGGEGFDFFVGSVHHVGGRPIDYDKAMYEGAKGACGGEEGLWGEYFDAQLEMLEALRPKVVGHFDLVRLFSEEPERGLRGWRGGGVWDRVKRNLEFVKGYGGLLEINSSALRKGLREPYPTREVCEEWTRMGGLFVLSDDSHAVDQVGTQYERVLDFVKSMGLKELAYLDRDGDGVVTTETMPFEEFERHEFWSARRVHNELIFHENDSLYFGRSTKAVPFRRQREKRQLDGSQYAASTTFQQSKILDQLLTAAYSAEYLPAALFIVDSLDKTYKEPTRPPVGSFSTPFKGKDARECCNLIQGMTRRTNSDINYEFLAILDKPSAKDSTALLVEWNTEENTTESVRAVFEVVTVALSLLSIGHGMMSEYQEKADAEPDGAFRIHPGPEIEVPKNDELAPGKFLRRPE